MKIKEVIDPILGKRCCRKRVGNWKSLSFGFGCKIRHGNPKLVDTYYGQWEIGTYQRSWRVVQGKTILLGGEDAMEIEELNTALGKIELKRLVAVRQSSEFDVRIEFDCEKAVEFLGAASDDATVRIFCPSDICAQYVIGQGWIIGSGLASSGRPCR